MHTSLFNALNEPSKSEKLQKRNQDSEQFLEKIYLKKTQYVIKNGKEVSHEEKTIETIKSLRNCMPFFKTGEVYEVLQQASNGEYVSYDSSSNHNSEFSIRERIDNKPQKKFLVQVIIQQVLVNDKLEQIVFFKDVTFGVLYEHIKAEEKLQHLISEILNRRIGIPFETLIKTVN